MADDEALNELFLTAVALLGDDDVGDRATAGRLELRRDGETWDVHKREDGLLVFVDVIHPAGFGSGRHLAAYLTHLHDADAEKVTLPEERVKPEL